MNCENEKNPFLWQNARRQGEKSPKNGSNGPICAHMRGRGVFAALSLTYYRPTFLKNFVLFWKISLDLSAAF
jgi:hypothetical protein